MQCSNCQFENLPGMQRCGRCGASLQLASLAIDVHPPRASRTSKRLRQLFPITRYWNRLRFAGAAWAAARKAVRWPADLPALGLFLRGIVPGWPQRHAGRHTRGNAILGCYLGLLLSGLLFVGTPLGWLLLGLAMSVHAASILDLVAPAIQGLVQWIGYSLAVLMLLVAFLYYPSGRLLAQVATPMRFNMAAPPFQRGDVVLINPSVFRWRDPRPGDVVLYSIAAPDFREQGRGHGAILYRLEGNRLDRIIAEGGQKVRWRQGQLLIDDNPSPWLPLNPQLLPDGLEITVPKDCFLVFPTTDSLQYPAPVWETISKVPRSQIGGLVYLRSQPIWRLARIR
jgi:hypothetical protein